MFKTHKKWAVLCIINGLLLELTLVIGRFDDYKTGVLSGIGSSLIVIGLVRLLKLHRLSQNKEKAAEYEAANKDERIRYIANKARSAVFVLSAYARLTVGMIALVQFNKPLVFKVLAYSVCIECLLYAALYWYYSRKY